MNTFLYYFIPIFFIGYFFIAFILKSIMTSKKIGKSAMVIPKDDSAYGVIGKYFGATILAIFFYIIFMMFQKNALDSFFDYTFVKYLGIISCLISLLITVIAQYQMKYSWRIGIDLDEKTILITSGLFGFSRNPIFLGMLLSLLGLFLMQPNYITLFFFIIAYILIQIQVRLEEEYLQKIHQQKYQTYKNNVGRFFTL
ncbi:isoprenylcysteine carboxylmethyltransferase family protein [Kordia sp. YSTF-M3]|uniref:Isoprenylcysteine carboxylmethyltransferase family protein n=1 Tax=Kordia aestuariivivens TaxID=2759037 RepID=A0ABR7QE69_9FLAO|nr:isoprenylcysteine carboxylmethyltransferase family protein [Kordia aestuariivivens]MBC8756619.1 isoprenylcysteine carboxylmethyltransferase family protein [Kordia aestuariivivens]